MADLDLLMKILLEGGDVVKKQLDDIGKSGKKSLDSLDAAGKKGAAGIKQTEQAITRASVSFVTAQSNLGKLGSALGGLGSAFGGLAKSVGIAVVAVAGIAAVAAPAAIAIFSIAKSAADATDAMRDAAIAAGTTTASFAELSHAAELSGAHASDMSRALAVIATEAGNAIEAGDRSAGAFKKLGINLVDAAGNARDTSVVFQEIAEKIANIENPATRAATAASIFGRKLGPGLTQTLQEGRKGLQGFAKDAQFLGIAFTDAQTAVGEGFNDALVRLSASLTGIKVAIGLAFAPGFTTMINNLADAIARMRPFLQSVAESAQKQLAAAFTVIADVINNTLVPALALVGKGLQLFVDAINSALGTNLSVADLVAFAAILITVSLAIGTVVKVAGGLFRILFGLGTIIGQTLGFFASLASVVIRVGVVLLEVGAVAGEVIAALNPITAVIIAIIAAVTLLILWLATLDWTPLVQGAVTAWNAIVTVVTDAVAAIIDAWTSTVAAVTGIWNSLTAAASAVWTKIVEVFKSGVATINEAWNSIKSAATSAWNEIVDTIKSAFSDIISGIQTVIEWLTKAWEIAKAAWEAITRVSHAPSTGTSEGGAGRARGGPIYGPGTGTSDSIPAWLSSGEWVIKAAAVKKYGNSLFAALNSMRLPASTLRQLLGRAQGGGVDLDFGSMMKNVPLRFAEGGMVPEQRVRLDLVIAGQVFDNLLAPRDIADKLTKFALNEQVKSGGKKPNWYR